jgi:hypothetical protein
MRKMFSTLTAVALVAPMVAVSTVPAAAHNGNGAREWQGADGRTYCRKSNGTVGLVIGGAGGALLGRAVDGGRSRATGFSTGPWFDPKMHIGPAMRSNCQVCAARLRRDPIALFSSDHPKCFHFFLSFTLSSRQLWSASF